MWQRWTGLLEEQDQAADFQVRNYVSDWKTYNLHWFSTDFFVTQNSKIQWKKILYNPHLTPWKAEGSFSTHGKHHPSLTLTFGKRFVSDSWIHHFRQNGVSNPRHFETGHLGIADRWLVLRPRPPSLLQHVSTLSLCPALLSTFDDIPGKD